jgi:hypothetical protein
MKSWMLGLLLVALAIGLAGCCGCILPNPGG